MKALNLAAFVVGLLGVAAVIGGVAMLSVPAALITGGTVAIAWSGVVARAVARKSNGKG